MRNLGWLVVLIAFGACDALSFEGSLFPTEENPRNCVTNPTACAADEVCDRVKKRCISSSGTCASSGSCISESAAFCNAGFCVGCNALDASATEADQRCDEWSRQRGGNQRLCIGGACKECRSNADCWRPGKTFCNQANNSCVGCVRDADCSAAGSMICRTDESMLGTGELLTKIGECVEGKDVAYVKNQLGGCSETAANAGTFANPYCQIQTAIAKGTSFIRVLGGSSDYNPILVNRDSLQRVIVYGSGQGNLNFQAATVSNGAWLTLHDIGIKATDLEAAIQCDTKGRLTVRRVLISAAGVIRYGIRADQCSQVTIERTKIDGVSAHGIWINGGSQHRVVNNAITRSGTAFIKTALRIGPGVTNSIFAFNTVTGNTAGVLCEAEQMVSDSIIQGNDSYNISGCNIERVVTMGAMLVDVSAAGADPRLTGDSMTMPLVVDKAMQLPASVPPVTEDYFGNPRPAGGGLDIGFHEYR